MSDICANNNFNRNCLEAILFSDDGPGSRKEFLETYGSDEPLSLLVRRIVGLDASAAKAAFAAFLSGGQYSADQIQFINLIIDHLVANGMIKPEMLFAPPFTDFHDHGIAGVLGDDAKRVIGVIKQINNNVVMR